MATSKTAETSAAEETVAMPSQVIATAAVENTPVVLDLLNANMERMSTPPVEPWTNPANINFKVSYSKDYKGEKLMPEGSVQIVSNETAAHFEKLGIGSIIK